MVLTKEHPIFSFDEVYALKVTDGLESTIAYSAETGVRFSQSAIDSSFDEVDVDRITEALQAFGVPKIEVFGRIVGKKQRFTVYDVKFMDDYLAVPHAANVASYLKIPFVLFKKMKPTMTKVRKYKPVELRPLDEFVTEDNQRLVARYPDGR